MIMEVNMWSYIFNGAAGDTCHPRNRVGTTKCKNASMGVNMGPYSLTHAAGDT